MRPINSKNFGTGKIMAFFHNGIALTSGYIVKQMGTRRYIVTDGTDDFVVTLTESIDLAKRLDGSSPLGDVTELDGLATITITDDDDTKYITKLTDQQAISTDGLVFTWALENPIGDEYSLTRHVVIDPLVNTVLPAITGTARVGQTLTVSNGTWTGTPSGYAYQWKAAGADIVGATNATYAPVDADIGRIITCAVTASKTGAQSVIVTTAATASVVMQPLTNSVLPAITGTARVGQTLTVSNGTWAGSPSSYAYQWKAAGTNIAGATNATYPPVEGDVGKTITCTVTASKSGTPSVAATSTATATVATQPLANTALPAITGTAQAGQSLSVSGGTWTGTPTGYAYQWKAAGADIVGATATTYLLTESDVGKAITCTVTASKSGTASVGATSTATASVVTQPLVNTVLPTITGTAQVGQTLTATTGTWTGSPTSYTYQWKADTVNIASATNSTYAPIAGDVGKVITCTVTGVKTGTASVAATTTGTAAVVTQPLVNTVLPTITGTAQVGQTLTVSTGTWTGSPTSYTYQWKADGANIASATASTYQPDEANVSKVITCTVTGVKSGTASVPVTTAGTAAVATEPLANTVLPVITGTAQVGQTLSVSTGTWTGNPTAYAYQWKAAGTDISGATSATYPPVEGDVGKSITCTVTASKSGATSIATTTAGTAAVTTRPLANTVLPAITGTAQVGQTLTVSNGTWTGTPTSYAYQWKADGANIASATNATYPPVTGDIGKVITCTVTASKSGTASVPATTAGTSAVLTQPLANTALPAITGTAQVGQTLSVSNGTWTGGPTGYTYQWKAAGTNIASATSATYPPVEGDVGKVITCTVTATKSGTTSVGATSTGTAAVTTQPLANTVLPVITGTAQVGQTLSVSTGTWTGAPTSYTYQWKAGGADIVGATEATYLVAESDLDAIVTCAVTGVKSGATSVTVTSSGTDAVIAA